MKKMLIVVHGRFGGTTPAMYRLQAELYRDVIFSR
jgi:hypothetical protein